jgi:hypothetical protein
VTAGRLTEPRALLLSGTGRYADPWHPFAETSAALAGLLREQGFGVEMAEDVDAALARLAAPGGPADAELPDGRPLLVSHVSSTSFLDSAEWAEALGGRWIRGTSMHPEYGPAAIHLRPESGALVEGIADFELLDERYSYLQTAPAVTVHATHTHEDREHPVMWSLDRRPGRTFYDALGHAAASYDSPEHRELLLRAISWLAAG